MSVHENINLFSQTHTKKNFAIIQPHCNKISSWHKDSLTSLVSEQAHSIYCNCTYLCESHLWVHWQPGGSELLNPNKGSLSLSLSLSLFPCQGMQALTIRDMTTLALQYSVCMCESSNLSLICVSSSTAVPSVICRERARVVWSELCSVLHQQGQVMCFISYEPKSRSEEPCCSGNYGGTLPALATPHFDCKRDLFGFL